MKSLLKLLFVFILFLYSCSTDNRDDITQDINSTIAVSELLKEYLVVYSTCTISTLQEQKYLERPYCFQNVYPLSMEITDINNEVELRVANNNNEFLDVIYDFLAGLVGIDFIYPFDVILEEDGSVVTINNDNELNTLDISCSTLEREPEDCLILDFPVTLLDYTGGPEVINSQEEFTIVTDGLFGSIGFYVSFEYPISGTLVADGSTVIINDSEEFDSIYNNCFGIPNCSNYDLNCFNIQYPITCIDASGTINTFNNDLEFFFEFFFEFTFNNSADTDNNSADTDFFISYPITVELQDLTLLTINSNDEFTTLFESCIN